MTDTPKPPEGSWLDHALASIPSDAPRDVISERTGYLRSSRDTYLQRMNAKRLIETESGQVRASGQLF